jgi:hypothetical protein
VDAEPGWLTRVSGTKWGKNRGAGCDAKETQRPFRLLRERASRPGRPVEPAAAEAVGGLGDLFDSAYHSSASRLELRQRRQPVVGLDVTVRIDGAPTQMAEVYAGGG